MSLNTHTTCNTTGSLSTIDEDEDEEEVNYNNRGVKEEEESNNNEEEIFYYTAESFNDNNNNVVVPLSVTRVVVEEGVTSIPSGAFDGRRSLEEVDLPSTITSIERRAFAFCENLKGITIPEGTISLGDSSFSHCYSLQHLSLPDSLIRIDDYAFSYCHTLKEIILPPKLERIGEFAFYNFVSLESISIPKSVQFNFFFGEAEAAKKVISTCFKGCINLLFDEDTYDRLPNDMKKTLEENQNNPWAAWYHDNLRDQVRFRCEFTPPEDDLKFKGKLQRGGWGPQYWSITIEQLQILRKHPLFYRTDENGYYNFTMRDFVKLEIIPITHNLGMGYALFLNQMSGPKHARTIVSHSWDEPIAEFIDAIENSGTDGPYWICAFALYQNTTDDNSHGPTIDEQLGPDLTHGPISTVQRSGIESMITILNGRCDIYKRLWCVYEMYMARKLGVNVILCPPVAGTEYDGRYINRNICIRDANKRFDSSLARCGRSGDDRRYQSSINNEDSSSSSSSSSSSKPLMNNDECRIRHYINHQTTLGGKKFAEVDEALEIIRCQYLLHYQTSKIEHCKTKGHSVLKNAIEGIISHLLSSSQDENFNNRTLVDLNTFLKNELEFYGEENYKRIRRKNRDEYPDYTIDHDYYIIGKRKKIKTAAKPTSRLSLLWKKKVEEEEVEEEVLINIFEKWREILLAALQYK